MPTVNFVLRWITGQTEAHQYDKDLMSLDLITADGYEPVLPLSLVLHIDYEKAPSVVQRFGDVRRLISQTLDPILSAYFRDVAQSSSMLDLLSKREEIQKRATEELGRRFQEYDINCVAVLIGRPESKTAGPRGPDRAAVRPAPCAAPRARAEGDLRQAGGGGGAAQGAERRPGGGRQADRADADAHRRRDRRPTRARRSSPRRGGWPSATSRARTVSRARRSCSAAARPRASRRSACPRPASCCRRCAPTASRGCSP